MGTPRGPGLPGEQAVARAQRAVGLFGGSERLGQRVLSTESPGDTLPAKQLQQTADVASYLLGTHVPTGCHDTLYSNLRVGKSVGKGKGVVNAGVAVNEEVQGHEIFTVLGSRLLVRAGWSAQRRAQKKGQLPTFTLL